MAVSKPIRYETFAVADQGTIGTYADVAPVGGLGVFLRREFFMTNNAPRKTSFPLVTVNESFTRMVPAENRNPCFKDPWTWPIQFAYFLT